jgi:hypothetical protein
MPPTRERRLREELRRVEDEALVDAVILLTHQAHSARPAVKAAVREQRDIAKRELLRRLKQAR